MSTNEIATTDNAELMQIPDYLIEDNKEGLEQLRSIVRPPRVKIVQSMSKDLKAMDFAEGDVVLTPSMMKIGNEASPLVVTPIFTWTEYLCCNPHGVVPFVRDKSYDVRSELAAKCKNRVTELRPEGGANSKGEPYKISYNESYCFLCWLHNVGGAGVAAIITFMRGEAKYGSAFGSLIQMRNMAVYKGMYNLKVVDHVNRSGDSWKGFNASNGTPAWVSPGQFEVFKQEHAKFRAEFESGNVEVDYDDGAPIDAATASAEASAVF